MADAGGKQHVDFWSVLDEASESVEQWPAWQRKYEADVFGDDDDSWSDGLSARPDEPAG